MDIDYYTHMIKLAAMPASARRAGDSGLGRRKAKKRIFKPAENPNSKKLPKYEEVDWFDIKKNQGPNSARREGDSGLLRRHFKAKPVDVSDMKKIGPNV